MRWKSKLPMLESPGTERFRDTATDFEPFLPDVVESERKGSFCGGNGLKTTPILLLALLVGCGSDSASGGADASAVDASRPGDGGGGAEWQSLASVPDAVQETAVVELGGLIYVIGGIDAGGGTLSRVSVYDVAGDSWSNGSVVILYLPGSMYSSYNPTFWKVKFVKLHPL